MDNLTELEKNILKDIMVDPRIGRVMIAKKYDLSENLARRIVKECKTIIREDNGSELDDVYDDLLEHATVLERQRQRLRDQQRIERKIRDKIRVDNALEDYTLALIDVFKDRKVDYKIPNKEEWSRGADVVGIFQISDTHFNELIEINGNSYDFKVAAKRLQKYVSIAKNQFKNQGIRKVIVAMTGDILNSDRRLDELLNMSTNRAKATSLSAILLEQTIADLAQDFYVTVTYVTGNESRAGQHMGSTEIMVSDNYDVTIFEMLKLMFREKPVVFLEGSVSEKVIQILNKHILLLHGHQLNSNLSKQSQQIKGKYSDLGIKVDYMLFGHIHETCIADFYARSSSLCGANAYSNSTLQLTSRAAQNIHFVSNDGINSMKIDLQEYEDYEGYKIDEDLEAYNAKSSKKCKQEQYLIVGVV